MALVVTHPFVSAITDSTAAADAGQVLPGNWNAAHTVAGSLDLPLNLYGTYASTGSFERISVETTTALTPNGYGGPIPVYRIVTQYGTTTSTDSAPRPLLFEHPYDAAPGYGARLYFSPPYAAYVLRRTDASGAETGYANLNCDVLSASSISLAVNAINWTDTNTADTVWSWQSQAWRGTLGTFVNKNGLVGWSASTDADAGDKDTVLYRDAAGVVGVISSVTTSSGQYRDIKLRDVVTTGSTYMHRTGATLSTTGMGASAGTLTNAPAIGNPTKWIAIDDNGTLRYIPAW